MQMKIILKILQWLYFLIYPKHLTLLVLIMMFCYIERIGKFYTELYDSEQNTIIHTTQKEVPEIALWEVELRDIMNGIASGNDHKKHSTIDTLKAGKERQDRDNLQEGK